MKVEEWGWESELAGRYPLSFSTGTFVSGSRSLLTFTLDEFGVFVESP